MLFSFYAIMRKDSEKIFIAEFSDINLFKNIMNNFEDSEHIERFIIEDSNQEIVEEKILKSKIKKLVKTLY